MKNPAESPQSGETPEGQAGDELLPEYDLTDGERGKYAARYAAGTNLVRLDPDVAAAFPDPAEVNAVLRAVAGIIRGHAAGAEPSSERRSA